MGKTVEEVENKLGEMPYALPGIDGLRRSINVDIDRSLRTEQTQALAGPSHLLNGA